MPDGDDPKTSKVTFRLGIGAAFQNHFDAQVQALQRAITPILAADPDGKPFLAGTAVLIRSSARSFLVTAHHVLDDNKNVRLHYDAGGKPVPLVAEFMADKRHDIAAWKLPGDVAAALGANYSYLAPEQFRDSSIPSPKTYASVVGYPASRTKKRYASGVIDSEKFSIANLVASEGDGRIRIVFAKKRVTMAGERKQRAAPNPYGMSGGAIFSMPVSPAVLLNGGGVSFAGIATLWHRNESAMEGTSADVVRAFLETAFPTP